MNRKMPGAAGLISKEDALLVIIDMQERLFPAMADKEELLENVKRLVRFAGIVDLPAVFTAQEKLGDILLQIKEYLQEVRPVSKVEFDCFGCDAFVEKTEGFHKKTLILAGIEAHICVAQTALHAVSDYEVHVVSDAIASRSPHNRRVALNRMMQGGVIVTSTEMVIYEILRRAGTDTFREVLKLVK